MQIMNEKHKISNRHYLNRAPCNPHYIVNFSVSLRCIFSSIAQAYPMHRCASNSPNFSLHTLYFLCRKSRFFWTGNSWLPAPPLDLFIE